MDVFAFASTVAAEGIDVASVYRALCFFAWAATGYCVSAK